MCRTKSSLLNIWGQTPFSPHSGQRSTGHFPGSPAATSTEQPLNQCQSLPPTPCPSCTWQDTQKRSPRKSSGLKTNTIIFEFAQKGFFLPEAEGESWGQNVRTETALAYFSCQPADRSLTSKLLRKPWGGVKGLNQDKQTMNDSPCQAIFWFSELNLEFGTNSIVMCSLSVSSPHHL